MIVQIHENKKKIVDFMCFVHMIRNSTQYYIVRGIFVYEGNEFLFILQANKKTTASAFVNSSKKTKKK